MLRSAVAPIGLNRAFYNKKTSRNKDEKNLEKSIYTTGGECSVEGQRAVAALWRTEILSEDKI